MEIDSPREASPLEISEHSVVGDRRYCPIHGVYLATDESASCPLCAEDPFTSSASLRRVRVVPEDELVPDGSLRDALTPVLEDPSCPCCGTTTPLDDFRIEVVGELWGGPAAEFAEDGVCPDCYRGELAPHIREWTSVEWFTHHFEGWKSSLADVQELVVYEERAADGWLPEEERPRVIDVERTLAARREHLARCQRDMKALQDRYPAEQTTSAFHLALVDAGRAVERPAVDSLLETRAEELRDAEPATDPVPQPPGAVSPRTPVGAPSARTSGEAPAPRPPATPGEPKTWPWIVGAVVLAVAILALVARFAL